VSRYPERWLTVVFGAERGEGCYLVGCVRGGGGGAGLGGGGGGGGGGSLVPTCASVRSVFN